MSSEPAAPVGMPPLSVCCGGSRDGVGFAPRRAWGAPREKSARDAIEAAAKDLAVATPSSVERVELDNMALLGVTEVDGWDDDDADEDALDETCPPDAYGRGPPELERTLTSTLTVTRGDRGNVKSLACTASLDASLDGSFSSPAAVRKCSATGLTWVRGEVLGRGSLGIVFKALDQETGKIFAAKEVLINPSDSEDRMFRDQLQNEIDICKDLQHPHIVSYLGHDCIDSGLYIYLEYMPGGSLAQVLAQFGSLEESLMTAYTRELLEGLNYLHTRQPPVVHRDIKGANVLVGLEGRVKLADFGCSKRTTDTMSRTMKGSIPWMAPEVIANTGYGRAADVWSMGCVCLEMASEARSPWGQKFDNPVAAMFKIAMSTDTPPIPERLSSVCHEFIGLCVQRDAKARPTAARLLEHVWIRDLLLEEETLCS